MHRPAENACTAENACRCTQRYAQPAESIDMQNQNACSSIERQLKMHVAL